MHTVIRRYEGIEDAAEVTRRAVEEFAPRISDRPGFQGYWIVDAGEGVIATITVFETEDAAMDSTAAAAGWIRENLAHLIPNAPQVTSGVTHGVRPGVTV